MSCGLARGWSWEKAVSPYRRSGRPISVWAVPFGPGTDTWRSCRFVGAVFKALSALPGGTGRFMPCDVGANHCRLRHIGCSHAKRISLGGRFARRVSTWRLPAEWSRCMVLLLLCLVSEVVMEVTGLVGLVEAFKKVRLNRNSCTPRKTWYFGDSVSATCLEETEGSGAFR